MTQVARTVAFKPGERNIFFHILTACNLSCSHCYINPDQHGREALSLETIRRWLKLFVAPGKRGNVIFLGGEPTLHPDLAAAVAHAKQLGFHVTVDSNGYLFHDFLQRTSPADLDYLSFSLDGPDPAVNDPLRGSGVFAVCVENIRKAQALGFRTSLIYTVSSRNLQHLERMVPLLVELGISRFFIQVIGLRGRSALPAAGDVSLQVSREQWLAVVPVVAAQAAARGIHVTYPKVFLHDEEGFQCAGRVAENFFIFPNGRVYQCPLCEDYPINAYRIEEDRLVRIGGLREDRFFSLDIPEGCVMNKLLQPDTIDYDAGGKPTHRISCCLLKEEIG
ncbi:MAG: radical SAM protein [Desulfobulbaceae bacterium]|nr:MAG: radical SAM protein [Desulfobulbaceae bacterium]